MCHFAVVAEDYGLRDVVFLVCHEAGKGGVDAVVLAGLHLDWQHAERVEVVNEEIDLAALLVVVIVQRITI